MRNTSKPHRRVFVRSAIALATMAAFAPASAQSTSDTAAGPGLRVEVTGFRASLDSALRAKRDDKGIIDVIRYNFGITTNAVLLFISGLLIFTLALLADLIVRSRGDT